VEVFGWVGEEGYAGLVEMYRLEALFFCLVDVDGCCVAASAA
jgi:hypothetical protein